MPDGTANPTRINTQAASARKRRRSLGVMALEPRLMYDAAAGATVVTTTTTTTTAATAPTDAAHTTGEIWFTTIGQGAASRVEQIGVDGSNPATDAAQVGGTSGTPSGIVVDAARGKYFVAEQVGINNYIYSGNLATGALDSTPIYVGPLAFDPNTGVNIHGYISGLQLDAASGTLYFAQGARNSANTAVNDVTQTGIFKIGEDGSGLTQVATFAGTTLDAPQNIALDLQDNLVFFTDSAGQGSQVDKLGVANLSTHAVSFLDTTSLGASYGINTNNGQLMGIAVDPADRMLYFTTLDTSHQDKNFVFSAGFTVAGSGDTATATLGTIQQLYSLGSAGAPASIVLDVPDGLFYVANKTDKPDSGTTTSGSIEVGSLTNSTPTQPLTSVFETSTITGVTGAVRPVNLAFESTPTVTAGDSATFIIGGGPVVADAGLTAADISGQDLARATVTISGGFFTGDTLAADTTGTNITANYDSTTGALTLSGVDTPANYQRVLETVTFSSTNADPTNGGADTQRSLTWTVSDGNLTSNAATSTVVMHTPPTVVGGDTATFLGGGGPVTLDGTLTVSDADPNATLSGATVNIGSGFVGGDTLNFADQNGISGSYDSATGTLTLTGTASVANYQAALDSITYSFNPANADPTAGGGNTVRTVTWVVNDGVTNSSPVTSTLDAVHVAPSVVPDATATFTGGGPAVTLDGGMSVADPDSSDTLVSATVSIGGFVAGDTLNFTNTGTITGSYDAASGVLTLTGTASVADYQSALRSLTYSFTPGGDPTGGGSNTARTIGWAVNDGVATSNLATTSLETVHAPPSIVAGGTVTFTGGGTPVTLDGQVAVSDPDSNGNLTAATVTISSGLLAGDTLSAVTTGTAITASYNANTGMLTLTGQDTLAHYQSVLASVTYSFAGGGDPTQGGNTTRTVSWSVNDGVADSVSATSTISTVNAVHTPPTVAGAGNTTAYSKQGPAAVIDSALTLSDPDSGGMLTGATVTISSGFLSGDTLAAVTTGSITASYDASTGVLTLTGKDTIQNYQSVLDSVTYSSTNNNPSQGNKDTTRTITWVVDDGATSHNLSSPVTSTIDLTPGQSVVHAPHGKNIAPAVAWSFQAPTPSGGTPVTYVAGTSQPTDGDDRDTAPAWSATQSRGERDDHAAVDLRHAVTATDAELLAARRQAGGDGRHLGEGDKPAHGKPGLLAQLKAAGRHGLVHERQAVIKDLHKRSAAR